jgi:hypothetical protein
MPTLPRHDESRYTVKSKKTLRAESDLYFQLWREAEADGQEAEQLLGRVQTEVAVLKQMAMPAIWVLASNQRLARYELESREIHPRHPRVRILTEEYAMRGHRVERGDKVIIISHGLSSRLHEEFEHLLHRSNVRMVDLWVAHV